MPASLGITEPARVPGASPARRLAGHPREFLIRTQGFGPALLVAAVLLFIVGPGLVAYQGNPTGFVRFGQKWVRDTHPPAGAVIDTKTGYDGQYFWALARDPLLLHHSTVAGFHDAGFRLQRIAYPALAYALAAGQESALPWTLLGLNVIVVISLTLAFSAYARRRGWSGWWGLAVGLLPGLQFATMGDMSDALAVALMLGGLMAWQSQRRWLAAGLLAVAALAREPMLLAVAAVAVDAGARWYPCRSEPGALRRAVRNAWPVVVGPAGLYLAWQGYVHLRHGIGTSAPGTALSAPFTGLFDEAQRAFAGNLNAASVWDLVYLGLIVGGIGTAFVLLRRGITAPAVAALLFGLVLLILTFGNDWSYTRLSAPLFAALLLGGLERRTPAAIAICSAVAAMGALVPFVLA
jgi:hypothetical protein